MRPLARLPAVECMQCTVRPWDTNHLTHCPLLVHSRACGRLPGGAHRPPGWHRSPSGCLYIKRLCTVV